MLGVTIPLHSLFCSCVIEMLMAYWHCSVTMLLKFLWFIAIAIVYSGTFFKVEQDGKHSCRYVCRQGTICYFANDEAHRDLHSMSIKWPNLLGWYWGGAKAFGAPWVTAGICVGLSFQFSAWYFLFKNRTSIIFV